MTCLGLEWEQGSGYRSARLAVPSAGKPGFTRLASELTGVQFTNTLGQERYTTNQSLLNGSGVALGDIDGDGLCDIYLCSLGRPNALFRNRGNLKFEEITGAAGVACAGRLSTSAAFADIDGDGDVDLIVSSFGQGTLVFLNDGKGRFAPSSQAPLNPDRAAMSMALGDIDGDGDLDLYITNYRVSSIRDEPNTRFRVSTTTGTPVVIQVNGRPVTEPDLVGRFELDPNGKVIEHGEPDGLYLNDGKGQFTLASFTDGRFLDEDGKPLSAPPYDWGLSVAFRDLNNDGAPDIYVCNDFNSPDRIWINNGAGRFRALRRVAMRTTPLFSMGADFADLNRDGFDELFVADMLSRDPRKRHNQLPDILPPTPRVGVIDDRPQYSRNALFLNRGDMTFAEIGQFSGVDASEWSWSPVFLDVDLDGYEDLLIVTGNERDSMNADVSRMLNAEAAQQKLSSQQMLALRNRFARLELPNIAFRNRRNLTFEDASKEWGFDALGVSQGMALGDLDNDGDLDVVINNLNSAASVYRNECAAPRVAIRLRGLAGNRDGAGARISVKGGPVPQSQEMISGSRYLSGDQPLRTFAAGTATNELSIEVAWRSGRRSLIQRARANVLYEIIEADADGASNRTATPQPTGHEIFRDASTLLRHGHYENSFDDFARQPLLQRKLSQLGPGVAWFDLDNDGWDDLVIGSGAGSALTVFRNEGHGRFAPWKEPGFAQIVGRDQSGIVCFSWASGTATVLAGSANYEDGSAAGPVARQYTPGAAAVDDRLPGQASSTGPVAIGDPEGARRLALFIGGRAIGGRYPSPASSMLFRAADDRWELDSESTQVLRDIGLVSGAVWTDLDQDGLAELVLACEAGPVRVFKLRAGKLVEMTTEWGLAKHLGLWNGVAAGDFDNDGQLDLVVTNWGWNQRYQNQGRGELRIYYGDFFADGAVELIEAFPYPSAGNGKWLAFPGFASVAKALPFIRERVTSHEAYGMASVEEILGSHATRARFLPVNTFASMLFLNRGGRFEARALPWEAQLAPAFGASVGDMDGDGNEDLFLSQNFFALQPEIPRMDAGRGLWLRGDGKGGFSAVPGQESGVRIYGEQRGCALADFNRDGRVDLVVGQNGTSTRVFQNVGAKPGWDIRLNAGPGNTWGFGCVVRLGDATRLGPAREIQAGSGYWSQNSPTQVMAFDGEPTRVWVRWPGGQTTTTALPKGVRQVTVTRAGIVPGAPMSKR